MSDGKIAGMAALLIVMAVVLDGCIRPMGNQAEQAPVTVSMPAHTPIPTPLTEEWIEIEIEHRIFLPCDEGGMRYDCYSVESTDRHYVWTYISGAGEVVSRTWGIPYSMSRDTMDAIIAPHASTEGTFTVCLGISGGWINGHYHGECQI